MGRYKGFASLKSVDDLYKKLCHDFELLKNDKKNPYLSFNFFVTALHILDWAYPEERDFEKRKALEQSEIVLQICSHVANGAKHFEARNSKHKTVSNVVSGGILCRDFSKPICAGFDIGLSIQLDGEAQEKFGNAIENVKLASILVEFWGNLLKNANKP